MCEELQLACLLVGELVLLVAELVLLAVVLLRRRESVSETRQPKDLDGMNAALTLSSPAGDLPLFQDCVA